MATPATPHEIETRAAPARPRLRLVAAESKPARYEAGRRNWTALGMIAATHLALGATLLSSGAVRITRPTPKPVYVRFIDQPQVATPTILPETSLLPVKTEIVVPEVEVETPVPAVPAPVVAEATPPVQALLPPTRERAVAAPVPAPVVPPDFSAAQLDNPGPRYPALSRRNREQGTVTLKVLVSPEGRAQELGVEATSGFRRLDEAALDTVRHWKFLPARQAGRAVAAWVLVPVTFALS